MYHLLRRPSLHPRTPLDHLRPNHPLPNPLSAPIDSDITGDQITSWVYQSRHFTLLDRRHPLRRGLLGCESVFHTRLQLDKDLKEGRGNVGDRERDHGRLMTADEAKQLVEL